MTIEEFIRKNTQSHRDIINGINTELTRSESQRSAAEERFKRAGTEISKLHSDEGEKKQALRIASDKVIDAQRALEEIEQKRQEALETLIRYQEDQKSFSMSLGESQSATEIALNEIKKEQKSRQEADQRINKYRKELEDKKGELSLKMIEALEQYLKLQSEIVLDAFSSQEQYQIKIQKIEAFKKARHADPEIAKLWEQREEFKKFIETSSVPGVKDMLQESLRKLETQLEKKYPNSLSLPEVAPKNNRIEELLFYCNKDGKAVLLLPFSIADWDGAREEEPPENSSRIMCIVYNMLQKLKLKATDGNFNIERDRPVFYSEFDLESFATLDGFSVISGDFEIVHFNFSAVPRELQDVLNNEN